MNLPPKDPTLEAVRTGIGMLAERIAGNNFQRATVLAMSEAAAQAARELASEAPKVTLRGLVDTFAEIRTALDSIESHMTEPAPAVDAALQHRSEAWLEVYDLVRKLAGARVLAGDGENEMRAAVRLIHQWHGKAHANELPLQVFKRRLCEGGLRLDDFAGFSFPPVTIDYTNYRGERRPRNIVPLSIRFGCTSDHPEQQWLLDAQDVDKDARRTFAMRDIHAWGGAAIMRQPMLLPKREPAPIASVSYDAESFEAIHGLVRELVGLAEHESLSDDGDNSRSAILRLIRTWHADAKYASSDNIVALQNRVDTAEARYNALRKPAGPDWSDTERGILAKQDAAALRWLQQQLAAGPRGSSSAIELLEMVSARLETGFYRTPAGAVQVEEAPAAWHLTWRDQHDVGHIVDGHHAVDLLRRLFDEWPGGLEEIESAMRTSAERLEHINRLQADLSRLAPGSMGWVDFYGTPQPDNIVLPPQARIPRCPVTPGTHIRVRFRDGEELDTREPELMRWGWTRPYLSAADIVAWRFVERDSIF